MNEIRSYRDLLVWQKSMLLVKQIYQTSQSFPREEVYGLTAQIRRAAVSIPSNIAEGHGRHQTKDFIRFLRMSVGSLYELQTQVEIAYDLGYMADEVGENLRSSSTELERMLSSLIRKLEKRLT
ncbi:MAG: four helix bundle protein [Planctomycetaceae bacterium]